MENTTLLIVGCNYRYTTQRVNNAHFVLVDINTESGMARLITRNSKKDFWKPISELIYINNYNNQRKAERINKDGFEYLQSLIGREHAQKWAVRRGETA